MTIGELSGRVLDSRPRGRRFEPHRRHCFVSLSKNINPSLVLVQPRKTRPFITERLMMGCKQSNQTNKQAKNDHRSYFMINLHENHDTRPGSNLRLLDLQSDSLPTALWSPVNSHELSSPIFL